MPHTLSDVSTCSNSMRIRGDGANFEIRLLGTDLVTFEVTSVQQTVNNFMSHQNSLVRLQVVEFQSLPHRWVRKGLYFPAHFD